MTQTARHQATAASPGRIVIDPVTRIEGHMKVEVETDGPAVTNAWSSTQLYRGIEQIVLGRRPEDVHHMVQRVCGVCTNTHALTSIRAVENAMDFTPPPLARLIRQLILSALILHDHLVHFYHLHGLDWVDMTAAIQADPLKAAARSEELTGVERDPGDLFIAQKRLKTFAEKGRLGFLENAVFLGGHPAFAMTPEENLLLATDYLRALRVQVLLARAMSVFAGKNPHGQSMAVGGVTCYESLRPERVEEFRSLWKESADFIQNNYYSDLVILGLAQPEAADYGATANFLDFEEFQDVESGEFHWRSGVLWGSDLTTVHPFDPGKIEEHVARSWYQGDTPRKPYDGVTEPMYTSYDDQEKYSWSKAPRYEGKAMETGPLARRLMAYVRGEKPTRELFDSYMAAAKLPFAKLNSTLGRTAARCVESVLLARKMEEWINAVDQRVKAGDKKIYTGWKMPDSARGAGFCCVTRGGLSHWVRIENGAVANYQMVVPSTWNLGPRCAAGELSPAETSLVGTQLQDPERPVELLRTVHSFDPCIACSVHCMDARKEKTEHPEKLL